MKNLQPKVLSKTKPLFIIFAYLLSMTLVTTHKAEAKTCKYKASQKSAKVTWTGYKFTNQTPVSGSFKSVKWNQTAATDLNKWIRTVSFEIDPLSIKSGLKVREANIIKALFLAYGKTAKITGKVQSWDPVKKVAFVEFDYGKTNFLLAFNLRIENKNILILEAGANLDQMGWGEGLDRLTKICKSHHTGPDGKSLTWPDIQLKVKTKLLKKCW